MIILTIGAPPISHHNGIITAAGLTLPHTGWVQSFILEFVLSFFLMFIGISLKESIGYKPLGRIAVGGFIVAAGIIGLPISGASMNLARSIGPATIFLNLSYHGCIGLLL